MLGLGPTELIIILVIALIIFGPSRLPEIGRAIGKAINTFKKSSQDIETEVKKEFLSFDEDSSGQGSSEKAEGKESSEKAEGKESSESGG